MYYNNLEKSEYHTISMNGLEVLDIENLRRGQKIKNLRISGYSLPEHRISFLKIFEIFPNVEKIHLLDKWFFDKKGGSWEQLKCFTHLKSLHASCQKENHYPTLDLNWFPSLKILFIDDFKNVLNFEKSNVEYLSYLRETKDLTELNPPTSLTELAIVGNLKSLNGIEKATNIQVLKLSVLRNVTDTKYLDKLINLQFVKIYHSTKIDYNNFTTNPNIRALDIQLLNTKAKIPTIKFIKNLPNLEYISIMGDVADGDMSPFLELPHFKKCWFQNKKKYSHTLEQICAARNSLPLNYDDFAQFLNYMVY
jgi:hypothetical protein